MSLDMDTIDVSESEGGGSIDGNDSESEASGFEEEGDDVSSTSDGSNSDMDDSDDEGRDGSAIVSPISTYDSATPTVSFLSSSAPSPSMMTGRLGLFGGIQQTSNGDILRRSQEFERHGSSLQEAALAHDQQRFDANSAVDIFDRQATEVGVSEHRGHEAIMVEQGVLAMVSEQDSKTNVDTGSLESSSPPPSPALSLSPLSHSLQSTSPSSPSMSVSLHPLDSDVLPETRLPEALSSPSSFSTTGPIIPEMEEQIEPYTIAVKTVDSNAPIAQELSEAESPELVSSTGADDLIDEGVFEEEEAHGVNRSLNDSNKPQDSDSQGITEADSLTDGYGSLPLYTTHPTPAQQQNDTVQDPGSSSSSDAVVAELKEMRTMLQDLHKRMDRLEQSLHSGNPRPLAKESAILVIVVAAGDGLDHYGKTVGAFSAGFS
ncbi:hypothetical protein BGW39_010653 [Mortierella sp. 14UC]|nr:hypothetical protein BGW39_010653 [Mortierella sp. 14UC]